jgi:phage-related protein
MNNESSTIVSLKAEIVRLKEDRDDALAEIDRLQKGGCARDQKTTQFCAEAVSAIRERDEARGEAVRYRSLYYQKLGIDTSASWFPWETKP